MRQRARSERVLRNDENIPPRPHDKDRARFGFRKCQEQPLQPSGTLLDTLSLEAQAVSSTANLAPGFPLTDFFTDALGEPSDLLPLLNTKLVTNKLNYKSRIAEVSDLNTKLKDALREEGRRRRALREAVDVAQLEVGRKFEMLDGEVGSQRKALEETRMECVALEERLENETQRCQRHKEAVQRMEQESKAFQCEQDRLRQLGDCQAHRADIAEEHIRELRQALDEATHNLERERATNVSLSEGVAKASAEVGRGLPSASVHRGGH